MAISKIVMGKRYIVEEIEENSEKGGCGRILLGIIAAGVLLFVGVENNDKEHEDSTPIQRETSVETRIKNYKANEETSIEHLILTNSLEEERVEAYEESQSDEFQLNEQDVEDCEEVENVKTEYVEEQMTSKEQRKADREQRKADRKERREIKRKSKQTE